MSRLSRVYPADRVTLREVGLRDGLQLVKQFPQTPAKRDWIDREYAAGVRHFELGSFLPAHRFPQFADLPDVLDHAARLPGLFSAVLTLNEHAIDDALAAPGDELVCVVSASEAHSQANIRRSRTDSLALVRRAAASRDAAAPDRLINAGIAMAFGCSIAGPVAPAEVLRLAEACLEAGADIVGLADTVGYAGPREIAALCTDMARLCGDRPFIIHLHDTRGTGIANTAAALDHGAQVIDAALGGLGGCPFAPGATGNVAFEDVAYLCERMGFATGIDLGALVDAREIAARAMPNEPLYGAIARSGPPDNIPWRADPPMRHQGGDRMKTVTAAILATAASVTAAEAATQMRCSHQLPPAHHIAKVVDQWAAEVEKLSEGEIDVQVFGADSLVKANDNILAVAKGDIECAFSLNFQWGKTLPLMNVTVGPYIMSSSEAWKKWPNSEAAQFLEQRLADKGVKNIAWMFQTNSSVFTSKGKFLQTPADFPGVKMRGLGPAFDTGLTAMGATTVTMPGSEVYQGLATGVIDAAITDVSAAVSRKYYEVQDHFVVLPVMAAYLHGYVNPGWYDGLSDKSKNALTKAGEEASLWALEASQAAAAAAPDELKAQGVQVHVATDAENEAFKAAMQPAFNEAFAKETGADGQALLELVKKLQ